MRLKQAVIIEPSNGVTGLFMGMTLAGRAIVLLDRPTVSNAAIEVRLEDVKPLNCHWCQDKKVVPASGFTMEQHITNTVPEVECPYCI